MKTFVRIAYCLLALTATSAVQAQVLDQAPAGSLVVIKVSNIAATSAKLTAFFQTRGFAALMGDMAHPLSFGMTQLGIKQGVDQNGDMAIAVVDDGKGSLDGNQPPLVCLIPVNDYKAFVGNFANNSIEDGLDVLPIPNQPTPLFSTSWGKYAAVSQMKSLILTKPTGVALTGATAKLVAGSDISIWLDGVALNKKMQPTLQEIRGNMSQIVTMLPMANQKMAPVFTAYLTQVFNGFDQVLSDAQAMSIALNIDPDDIKATALTEYTPDSYMAKLTASFKGTDTSMLEGLPAGDYVAAGGIQMESDQLQTWLDDMINPIQKAAVDCGKDGQDLSDDLDSLKKTMLAQKGASMELSSTTKPAIISICTGDAAAMKAAEARTVSSSNDISRLMSTTGNGQSHITVKPNAKTVGGISFDAITTTVDNLDPNAAERLNALPGPLGQIMRAATSPDGSTAYYGQIDADRIISVANVSDDQLTAILADIEAKNAPLAADKALSSTADLLPKTRIMAFYVRRPGSPIDEAPLGIAISTDANTVRTDVVIPGAMATAMVQGAITLMQHVAAPANDNPAVTQPPPPMPGGGL